MNETEPEVSFCYNIGMKKNLNFIVSIYRLKSFTLFFKNSGWHHLQFLVEAMIKQDFY